jgi:hypothetical protein
MTLDSRAVALARRQCLGPKRPGTMGRNSSVDPRVAFLLRAKARLQLVESCDMTLSEAVHGLVSAMEEIIGRRLLCPCVQLDHPPIKRQSSIRRAA